MRKTIKFGLLGLLFGLLLYGTVYFMASHGGAFKYVDQKLRTSAVIESQIGPIKGIRLDPLGGYEEKSVGQDEWVTMRVKVMGAKATIVLDVSVKNTGGTWTVERVINQGSQMALD